MRRIEANRNERRIADAEEMQAVSVAAVGLAETETTPLETNEQSNNWRELHPLHKKYKHLKSLASYPDHMPDDEYPGECMKPDHGSTYIK